MIGSCFTGSGYHELFGRANHGELIFIRGAKARDLTFDLSVGDVGAVPSQKKIHAARSSDCEMRRVVRSIGWKMTTLQNFTRKFSRNIGCGETNDFSHRIQPLLCHCQFAVTDFLDDRV